MAVLKGELNSDMLVHVTHAKIEAVGIRMVEECMLNSTFVYVGAKPVKHESLEWVKLLPNLLVDLLPTIIARVPMAAVEHALLVHFSQVLFHLNPVDVEVAIV